MPFSKGGVSIAVVRFSRSSSERLKAWSVNVLVTREVVSMWYVLVSGLSAMRRGLDY